MRKDIPPKLNLIGTKLAIRGISLIYTPTDNRLHIDDVDPVTQSIMQVNSLFYLPNQCYQVYIKGKRTQHLNYKDALKYHQKHKQPRRSVATVEDSLNQTKHITQKLQALAEDRANKIIDLTEQLHQTKQKLALYSTIKQTYTKERAYYNILAQLKLANQLNSFNNPTTEKAETTLENLRELLDIIPSSKEFKEFLSQPLLQ